MSSVGRYCQHTARFAHNTGIQRCVRVIARALIDAGECLTLLVWDGVVDILLPAGAAAREHLARWSGPEHGPGMTKKCLALAAGCCWWS